MSVSAAPRRRAAPRAAVELPVTLARAKGHGNPVAARTIDVSTGGAKLRSDRPLRVDEVLHFDLICSGDAHVCGDCRVLREHVGRTYAVRFERVDPGGTEQLVRLAPLQ